jgi:cytochrome c peroxidase
MPVSPRPCSRTAAAIVASAALLAVLAPSSVRAADEPEEERDPAEVVIGERLFLETRFAQYFATHSGGDVNRPLAAGDPIVATVETTKGTVPGPFAGQSINCRSCHFVDDLAGVAGAGNRAYADFARRSPVPAREDGQRVAPRNAPALVDASLPRGGGILLHFDGEFASASDLVRSTLTGRNFGWLPSEHADAVAHIARVIREDDGGGALAAGAGGAYRTVLAGTDPSIPRELRLPRRFRIVVASATDEQIVDAVARLIAAYVESLVFAEDETGAFAGSPYDQFLLRNNLPRKPRPVEPVASYVQRLRELVTGLAEPVFVRATDGAFALHDQPFVFGPLELDGLRIFLRRRGDGPGVGNCVACHPPPAFTDFAFHNTGTAQEEYDAVHGEGRFAALAIPGAAARAADPDAFLPATPAHPNARGRFRAVPVAADPDRADLGLWNVLLNPDFARGRHQRRLARLVCRARRLGPGCTRAGADALLEGSIGLFKTPGLRDLGHSGPYNHTGSVDTLEGMIDFYFQSATLAEHGRLRNASPEFARMKLGGGDIARLAAFLRALNEDYQ